MKPTTKKPEPAPMPEAPAPGSGGSYIWDEATGTLTRQKPVLEAPDEQAVEAPVESSVKEAR